MNALITFTEEKQEELRKGGAEILTHSQTGDMIAVKAPSRILWRKFRQAATSDVPDKAELAGETLVYDCAVAPDAAALRSYFDQRPAAADVFATAIAKLAGFGGKAEKKD